MEADFSGYATKAGLKCSDGRTITPEAFKRQDKMRVPLVWQHGHSDSKNVLGHVDLEARDDGMYCYGYFNDTEQGQNASKLVTHGDVNKLSIYANQLVERTKQVLHGVIGEVSLVLAGANPGATIDYIRIAHSDDPDDIEVSEEEAIITTGEPLELKHSDDEDQEDEEVDDEVAHASTTKAPPKSNATKSKGDASDEAGDDGPSIQDVYDSMTPVQQRAVQYIVGAALDQNGGTASHSDLGDDAEPQEIYDALSEQQKEVVHSMIDEAQKEAKAEGIAEHSALIEKEGTTVNVFENGQNTSAATLQHAAMMKARESLKAHPDAIETIVEDARRNGGKLSESFIAHAAEYGIENIDLLFPDATLDQNGISIISRRTEWVQNVLTNTRHSPFSRVKSLAADLTAEEARAKGYVKGTLKKDEVIKMLRRVTLPKTIYKKQKLDRDDVLDITELDIVAWLKAEMRVMLDEEVARAVLIGDGRDADDDDKIDEESIRPVAYDIDMYTERVELPAGSDDSDLVDLVVSSLDAYKGSGNPTFYTTQRRLTQMLLSKDTVGRRLYPTKADLANALLVNDVVPVEVMESDTDLVGVIVNLADYTIGADAGGQIAMFDDFDIDFNQQKYLIETRVSGALTKPKSAIAIFIDSGHTVTPQAPTFNSSTGVVTIPAQTGVSYVNAADGTTFTTGAQPAIAPNATLEVHATPVAGYGFSHNADTVFEFTRGSGS